MRYWEERVRVLEIQVTLNFEKTFHKYCLLKIIGGGLYVEETILGKKRRVVSGITSYGAGCARPGLPG